MDMIQKVVLISGKRKCGKDYLARNLQKRLGKRAEVVRISEPIKREWAKKLNLSLEQLLSDGPGKEMFRKDMIEWSDEIRINDYAYFCRAAMAGANAEIIIVSDIRRKKDLKYFREKYNSKVLTIRLTCPELIRAERGWIYTVGIDDVASECDLDDYDQWDLVVENNSQMDGEQVVDLILAKFQF